jgi:peptide/nickel transport system substrate-binding protein
LGWLQGFPETGFLCRSRWGDRDFAEKPGFLGFLTVFYGVTHIYMIHWQRFFGLFLICLFLTVSCGQGLQNPANHSNNPGENRITLGTTAKLRTIDPADAYDLTSGYLLNNLGDPLYRYNEKSEIIPQLATELPQISEDGLTYTIPLRQGVIFHDRTPFNAEAMAFSLRRFIENQGQPSFLLSDIVDSIEATAEYQLTITLKKPFAAFTALLTFFGSCAVSPTYYEIGAGQFKPDTFVGTGRYQLVNYGTDSLQLDSFPDYWGDKPANQGVDIQRLSNSVNLYNAFTTGAVDVAYETLDPNQIKSLESEATAQGWQVISTEGNSVTYWMFNSQQTPLDNLEVRQALAAMVDRELLIERVSQGQAEPLYSLIPSTFPVYKPVFEGFATEEKLTDAKTWLKDAGYSPENPLKIEVWYPSSSPVRNAVATALKAIAQQKLDGLLELQPQSVEFTTYTANLDKGIYQTVLYTWVPDFLDPDNFTHPFLSCTKGSSSTGCESGASRSQGSFYYSDRANELINQQRQELDTQKRNQLFTEIQELVAEDIPYVPLFQNKDYAFAQKDIGGVNLNPSQIFPFWNMRRNQ